MKTTFHIRRNIAWAESLDVYVLVTDAQGRRAMWNPVEVKTLPDQDIAVARDVPPAFDLQLQDAQQLMDELWHVGLRPSEGTGSAGALAATQAHLKEMTGAYQDMRNMANRLMEKVTARGEET